MKTLVLMAALSTPQVTVVHPSAGDICPKNQAIEVSRCDHGSAISCGAGASYRCDEEGLPTRSETQTKVVVERPSVSPRHVRRARRAPLRQKSIFELLFGKRH